MTGLADVDGFIICIQECVLLGFRPLKLWLRSDHESGEPGVPSPQAAWVVSAPGDPDGIPDGEYGRHAAGSGIPVAGLRDPRLAQNVIVSQYSELTVVVVCYAVHWEKVRAVQSWCEYT